METILTVLITLGVCALAYTFMGVMRLSRRVDDLELMRMEVIDVESRFDKAVQDLENELTNYQKHNESSLDRRLDSVWCDVHKNAKLTRKLDKTLNPNVELLKS
tara:strand:- start:2069 stop:2380 length:312 start_codon:yes stop_codon:yes gene_type:complete